MSHESLWPMKWRRWIGKLVNLIAILASSAIPCMSVFASQLIENIPDKMMHVQHAYNSLPTGMLLSDFFIIRDERGHILLEW